MTTATEKALSATWGEQSHEEMWIEIVREMEHLYAELARSIAETERKNEALQRAKEFTEKVLSGMNNALLVVNEEGLIRMVNPACLELLGHRREELLGETIGWLMAPESAQVFSPGQPLWQQVLNGGAVRSVELLLRAQNGAAVPVSFSAAALLDEIGDLTAIVCIAVDLREVKQLLNAERQKSQALWEANRELRDLQARLVHSEKMSSLGRMATGVAHEINSPLSGVMVYSHLLLEDTPEADARRQNLQKVIHEAERCQQIIRGMLEFARTNPGQKQPVDLNEVVRVTVAALRDQNVFRNIALRLELAEGLPEFEGEQSQLQQACGNLILNAVQAMPAGGSLAITSWLPHPDRVTVSFCDTGCGIAPQDLNRVFEPFFSTKHGQGGTGLGLAITHSIIERHGGKLEAQSEIGKGTTFFVTFPVSSAREKA